MSDEDGAERVLHVIGNGTPWDPGWGEDSPLSRKKGALIARYADGPHAGQLVVIPDDTDYVIERDGTVYA